MIAIQLNYFTVGLIIISFALAVWGLLALFGCWFFELVDRIKDRRKEKEPPKPLAEPNPLWGYPVYVSEYVPEGQFFLMHGGIHMNPEDYKKFKNIEDWNENTGN